MHTPNIPVTLSMQRIGDVLRKARTNLRLSYRQVSAISGVSAASIQRIEIGLGEHSVRKLFRLCVALGVPIADLIAYALVSAAPMPESNMADDPDVQAAIAWARHFNGIPPRESLETLREMGTYMYRLLSETLCGARPTVGLIGRLTPSGKCNARLESLQIELDGFSNSERLATLETLFRAPVAKLKSLGLLTPEIMQELLSQPSLALSFKSAMPEAVENVLFPVAGAGPAQVARPLPESSSQRGWQDLNKSSTQVLTDVVSKDNIRAMQDQMQKLRGRLTRATTARGQKAALAKWLGVSLSSVSTWLAGRKEPSGKTTLRLLQWVEQHERQQNTLGSATNTTKGKTQVRRSSHEKQTQVRKNG